MEPSGHSLTKPFQFLSCLKSTGWARWKEPAARLPPEQGFTLSLHHLVLCVAVELFDFGAPLHHHRCPIAPSPVRQVSSPILPVAVSKYAACGSSGAQSLLPTLGEIQLKAGAWSGIRSSLYLKVHREPDWLHCDFCHTLVGPTLHPFVEAVAGSGQGVGGDNGIEWWRGIGQRWSSGTRSFLSTVEAGLGEQRIRLDSVLILPAVRAGVQTADGERPVLLTGPVVIDPAFSSVCSALIIFLTLLSAQSIGDILWARRRVQKPCFDLALLHRILLHKCFTHLFKEVSSNPVNPNVFCCICVQNSVI